MHDQYLLHSPICDLLGCEVPILSAGTATAFAPVNDDHLSRIPARAVPFDSDYLLTGEVFEVTLEVPGVYDYYCMPHEMAGTVGRIAVAEPGRVQSYPDGDLEQVVLERFPPVADIFADSPLHHKEG